MLDSDWDFGESAGKKTDQAPRQGGPERMDVVAPVHEPLPQFDTDLKGARSCDQLGVDFQRFLKDAQDLEFKFRNSESKYGSCQLDRANAAEQLGTLRTEYQKEVQHALDVERYARECNAQLNKCKKLKQDYDILTEEVNFLRSQIQKQASGTAPAPIVRREPARPQFRPEFRDEESPDLPPQRRRYAPAQESPICVIL